MIHPHESKPSFELSWFKTSTAGLPEAKQKCNAFSLFWVFSKVYNSLIDIRIKNYFISVLQSKENISY